MTNEQQYFTSKASNYLQKARFCLDNAMYYTKPKMSEGEFKKVREAYDLICKANDKL